MGDHPSLLQFLAESEYTVRELLKINQNSRSGSVLEGIGQGIGSVLQAAGEAGDKVIGALGKAIHETFSGAGGAGKDLVEAIGDSTTEVIDAGGNAVKNSAEGVSYIFDSIFGGIPNLLIWIVLLPLLGYIGYLKFTGRLGNCGCCQRDLEMSISDLVPGRVPGVIIGKIESESYQGDTGSTHQVDPPMVQLSGIVQASAPIYTEMASVEKQEKETPSRRARR